MKDYVLGYDCDGGEIIQGMILRAIWSNDIPIEESNDSVDPRQYCAIWGGDGKAYAISVFDWHRRDLIIKREHLNENEEIPVVVKPIEAMKDYEIALCNGGEKVYYYEYGLDDLKKQLNNYLKLQRKQKKDYDFDEI